ncbi:MAG: alpha/beta fold hydrolase [Spirochaetota bacterium]
MSGRSCADSTYSGVPEEQCRLLEREGVSQVTVIGLSAGGGMAQMLLQRYPRLVDDVVLSHTGIMDRQPDVEAQMRRLTRLVRLLPMPVVRWILRNRTSSTSVVSTPWRAFHDAYFRESSAAITKAMVLDFLRYGVELRERFEFRPGALNEWGGRMMILSSRDDTVTFTATEALRERYPRSGIHVFEEGGHHTFMLFPEAYTAKLKEFLERAR